MKFSKYLENQSVPEWRKAYICYKGLKKDLKAVERFRKSKERKAASYLEHYFQNLNQPSHVPFIHHFDQSTSRPGSLQSDKMSLSVLDKVLYYASSSERQFFESLDFELDKIAKFYDEKETDAKLKLEALKTQMQFIAEMGRQLLDTGQDQYQWFKYQNGEQRISYAVARSRLKKAITEYYRSLGFLKSYQELNETGFRKILKKFDKVAGWKASPLYMKVVESHYWVNSNDLNRMMHETETLYINEFADGHRRRGMSKLRAPEPNKNYNSTTLRVGILLGITIPLFIQASYLAMDPQTIIQLPNLYINTQIYASFLLPILFCLGFSINLIVWHRFRINYKLIFELNSRDNLDYHQFAELPSILLLISCCIMYIDFSQLTAPTIPSELYPLILFIILAAIMLCPFNVFYLSARRWLGITLGRIILSYCFPVEFRDFFVADELNSLSYSIWTISYFFCAYSKHWSNLQVSCNMTQFWISPILASLPPWWRLVQCVRRYKDSNEKVHLFNAAKYTTSITATLITGLKRMHPFSVEWNKFALDYDMFCEFMLYIKNTLLRDELVFNRWTYYVAIPINILLRFSWILGICRLHMTSQLFSVLIALLEAYRRIQWNFFRLENEHLNNCGQYRAIKEIPLPFALTETNGSQDPLERIESTQPIAISRHPSYHTVRHSYDVGSFYGRRDFENKQDEDMPAGSASNLRRKSSTIENILAHIRYLKESDQSEDEEYESKEYDGDDDDERDQ
ncbi:hypothetical protein G6F33_004285 [Rhizopus arrhizus]|nr:hypothetical protein G6F33_004285 [Rhizopus arrhizus]KAG1299106.1 hypothetical protein G6F66_001114 [Rhizopus arrhizus]